MFPEEKPSVVPVPVEVLRWQTFPMFRSRRDRLRLPERSVAVGVALVHLCPNDKWQKKCPIGSIASRMKNWRHPVVFSKKMTSFRSKDLCLIDRYFAYFICPDLR